MPLIDLLFARAQVARPIARYWGRQRLIDFAVAHPEAALGTLLDSTTEYEVPVTGVGVAVGTACLFYCWCGRPGDESEVRAAFG